MSMFTSLMRRPSGTVCMEYLLLITVVGVGTIAGIEAVRCALVDELVTLSQGIVNMAP